MAKKRTTAKKARKPTRLTAPSIVPETMPEMPCAICSAAMKLRKVIPAVDLSSQFLFVLPELRTFQCVACRNLKTVEQAEADHSLPVAA